MSKRIRHQVFVTGTASSVAGRVHRQAVVEAAPRWTEPFACSQNGTNLDLAQ